MAEKPIISILIPTKNRERFALNVVHHILEIKDERLQVVVYNNSDTNRLQELLVDHLNDDRLKYFFDNSVLSFVDNFSRGISKCDGHYLTIIGDDDGINPFIIEIAEWAYKNQIEAITPTLPCIYNWPGSGVNGETGFGRLVISWITCEAKFYNARKEVLKLLENGCQNYLSYNLAKAYHGLVKKSVLDEIKNRTSNFIGGLSPDIYLSIATSLLITRVLVIDYPLTISGICKSSGSADSANGTHTGKLEQAPHFRGRLNYQWSKKVPAFYSVETIWADSALAALRDMKFQDFDKFFNIDVLSAYCFKKYARFKDEILENMSREYEVQKNSLSIRRHLYWGYINGPLKSRLIELKDNLLKNNSYQVFEDVADIQKASQLLHQNIQSRSSLILKHLNEVQ